MRDKAFDIYFIAVQPLTQAAFDFNFDKPGGNEASIIRRDIRNI
ncbi:MAG: hypothetical protein U0Y68_11835 [Blastocatellia bacterium]